MGLIVKEIFNSIQGEGVFAGSLTTFIRLAGCSVNCPIKKNCDTDYNGGDKMSITNILMKCDNRIVCITGGEPLEQDILQLCISLRETGKQVHIQTSGTIQMSDDLFANTNHVVCSPKTVADKIMLSRIDEIKVVYYGQDISNYYGLSGANYNYIQPLEKNLSYNIEGCIKKARELEKYGQKWKISIQNHKLIGVR